MTKKQEIQIFENKKVRTAWDSETEQWYFSIVDIVAILTESVDPQAYWRKLKQRLKNEGNETVTTCHALKMISADGILPHRRTRPWKCSAIRWNASAINLSTFLSMNTP